MKRIICILVAVSIFLLAGCSSQNSFRERNLSDFTPSTTDAESVPTDTTKEKILTYPKNVRPEYRAYATEIPDIVFTTTGAENGLQGSIYTFEGKVLDSDSYVMDEYNQVIYILTVETEKGNLSVFNMYRTMYELIQSDYGGDSGGMLTDDINDYQFPDVGETAEFIGIYDGLSLETHYPVIYLGASPSLFWAIGIDDPLDADNNQIEPKTEPVIDEWAVNDGYFEFLGGEVTMTITGLEKISQGISVNYTMENNSTRNVSFSSSYGVINGIVIPNYFTIDVPAGKKTIGSTNFLYDNTVGAKITKIATFSAPDAYLLDGDTYEKLEDTPISFNTPIADTYTQEIDYSGEIVYEQNGVTVIAKNVGSSIYGPALYVLVKNDSDSLFYVQEDHISVNGLSVSTLYNREDVPPGSVRYCAVNLGNSFDNTVDSIGLENITNITFTLDFMNPNSLTAIWSTGEISVDIK